MVFHIVFAYTTLDGILETLVVFVLNFDTRLFVCNPFGNGMNLPPRVGLNLSMLNCNVSIWVITKPLFDNSILPIWNSISVAIWVETCVISSSLVILYLLFLTVCLTSSLVLMLLKVLKVLNITFIPLFCRRYSFILKSWCLRYCNALMPLTLMLLMALEVV